MKRLLLAITTTAIISLSTTAHAFLSPKVITKKDDFDGSTIVHAEETGLLCSGNWFAPCPLIGFGYMTNHPEHFVLSAQMMDSTTKNYYNINKIAINIDGEIKTFDAISTTKFEHSSLTNTYLSTQTFALPLAYLDELNNGKDIKVRVSTDKGNFDGAFKGGKKKSVAEKQFPEFYKAVQANKPTQKQD